jgi:signal peptidase II
MTCFLLTMVIGVALDLWSKDYSFDHLAIYSGDQLIGSRVYKAIPGLLEFTVTTNQGAVFGLGAGKRPLFVAVSLAAILFLIYLFAHSQHQRFYEFILGMLLAGVLGNLYDRMVFGYVRDMIHILSKWNLFPWIFNVADVMLCTGVGLMVLYSLLYPGHEQAHAAAATTSKPGDAPHINADERRSEKTT